MSERAYPIPCQSVFCDSHNTRRLPRQTTRADGLCTVCASQPVERYARRVREDRRRA